MFDLKIITKSAVLTAYSIFNIFGIFVLAYLLVVHFQAAGGCVAELFGDCGIISKSEYSTFLGIPIALLGILWLGMGLIFALLKLRFMNSRILTLLILVNSSWSIVYAIYLIFLEAFIIRQWCQYCLLTDLFIVLAFIAAMALFVMEKIEIDAQKKLPKAEKMPK